MRLTLRTMLAYMDDVLDADDAKELGEKIENSEFARSLVQRIRNSTRRLRLGAPGLGGKGMGSDPNTVAEYLDSTLPPDRMPDFEKVCLESDVHLAEAASCHQILTLVLGEAAEVQPETRHRIYLIGAPDTKRPKPEHAASTAAEPAAQPEPAVTAAEAGRTKPESASEPEPSEKVTRNKRIEVPEYLRGSTSRRARNMAIALVLAFVVTGLVLRLMGPLNGQHPLLRWFGGGEPTVAEVTDSSNNVDPQTNPAEVGAPKPSDDPASSVPSPAKEGSATEKDADAATTKANKVQPGASVPKPGDDNETPVAPTPKEPGTLTPTTKDVEPKIPPTIPTDIAAPKPGLNLPSDPPPGEPSIGPPKEPEVDTPTAKPEPKVPAAPVEVGYVRNSDQQFLVRLDPNSMAWQRLPARSKLFSGERIAALPTFRPEIVLAPSVQVTFGGAAHAVLLPPNEAGEPGMALIEGRVFVGTAGVAGAGIHMNLGGRDGTLTFGAAASEAAIDVSYFLRPGANPEQEPAQVVVKIFAPLGQIQWQESGGAPPVDVTPGQARVISGDISRAMAALQLPAWTRSEDIDGVERMASQTLEPFISSERPVVLSLNERIQDRKAEVRSLAARCLAHLDVVEPIIDEFSDDRQRSFWDAEFLALRKAIARGGGSAANVRETLERVAGTQASTLYRLLIGFGPQQLAEGGDATLVSLLDAESLNIRVLAFENLRRITNKTLYYRPDVTEARRKSSIKDWEQRLENDEIVYDSLPTAMTIE